MYFNNIILATKDYVEIILKHLQLTRKISFLEKMC